MTAPVEQLEQELGARWPTIRAARADAKAKLDELGKLLVDLGSSDAAIVIYGSLARHEWTSKSDIDWTLLVDGPARPDQMVSARKIRAALEQAQMIAPSPSGAFGSMSFSHELVHRIGGEADTNRITTQRVLLLLESVAVPAGDKQNEMVHERVIRSVLDSYLEQHDEGPQKKVPRFLLNDVVRYWRTLAVDSAAKMRERSDKWAMRRLKLQTSRKLIFSAGLVMALESSVRSDRVASRDDLFESLTAAAAKTPLDIIAEAALTDPTMIQLAKPVFGAYERFLALIDERSQRERLEKILREEAGNDPVWQAAKAIGGDFGSAIENFFFDGTYSKSVRAYGVF